MSIIDVSSLSDDIFQSSEPIKIDAVEEPGIKIESNRDFYKFINSKDVREFYKNNKYEFNSLEAAWIVAKSNIHIKIDDKLNAFSWIIENMDDMYIEALSNDERHDTVFKSIKNWIDIVIKSIDNFFNRNDDEYYSFTYYYKGDQGWTGDNEIYFKSFEKCFNNIIYDMSSTDIDNIKDIHITKNKIESLYDITLKFNVTRSVVDVIDTDIDSYGDLNIFDYIWLPLPHPFKKGDVCKWYYDNEVTYHNDERGPFVYIASSYDDYIEGKRLDFYKQADSSDMNIEAYFQDPDGRIYHECHSSYMDMEYYDIEHPEGIERLLKALSNYLKGKIPVDLLLTTYRKVILDEFANNDPMTYEWYHDDFLKLAGLIDETTDNEES